jgi:hypothetical protein
MTYTYTCLPPSAAFRDLDGRFFAGRQVKATFFDEGKFERFEFAPA